MRRLASAAFILLVLVTAGGCDAGRAPVTSTWKSPTPSPAPSPPPPVSVADLTSWVDHAQLSQETVGSPMPAVDRSGTAPYTAPCKTVIVANRSLAYSRQVLWIGTRIDEVYHDLFA